MDDSLMIYNFISKQLLMSLIDLTVISFFVAIISIGLTQSFKIIFSGSIFENSLRKNHKDKISFMMNIIFCIIISFIVVYLFSNVEGFISLMKYILLTIIFSWTISILSYDNILKSIFDGFIILRNKVRNIKLDTEIEENENKLKLLETKILIKEKIKELELMKLKGDNND